MQRLFTPANLVGPDDTTLYDVARVLLDVASVLELDASEVQDAAVVLDAGATSDTVLDAMTGVEVLLCGFTKKGVDFSIFLLLSFSNADSSLVNAYIGYIINTSEQ